MPIIDNDTNEDDITFPNRPLVGEFTAESFQRAIDIVASHIEYLKKNGIKPTREKIVVPNKQAEEFVKKWAKIMGINIEVNE